MSLSRRPRADALLRCCRPQGGHRELQLREYLALLRVCLRMLPAARLQHTFIVARQGKHGVAFLEAMPSCVYRIQFNGLPCVFLAFEIPEPTLGWRCAGATSTWRRSRQLRARVGRVAHIEFRVSAKSSSGGDRQKRGANF